jgi:hypothetical protein
MNNPLKSKIMYIVMCIDGFAQLKNFSTEEAYLYLRQFGGIEHLDQLYDIEHTLPFDDTMDALTEICQRNGGVIQ